ncbi:MAG: T9SS type A sorting domain-containing protein [Chitinophagales bacterium]
MWLICCPNPAVERITLSLENSVEQLKLYNNLGKEIQVNYSDINSNKKQIDISNLSTGVYILKKEKRTEKRLLKN